MKKKLLNTVESSRNYLLDIAEKMPDNLYSYKPNAISGSFADLLNHIAYGIEWFGTNFILKNETEWNPPLKEVSKRVAKENVEKAYGLLKTIVDGANDSPETILGFVSTLDHIAHHRGQLLIYMRNNSITPPEYVPIV